MPIEPIIFVDGMSIWSRFIKLKGVGEEKNSTDRNYVPVSYDTFRYAI